MRNLQRTFAIVILAGLTSLAASREIHAQLITSWEGDPGTTAGTPDGLGGANGWTVPGGTDGYACY